MGSTISLAMIVKDEADQLAECLRSAEGLVDEICVVDTGSRDNTLEIAKSFKARTSVFLWCDDFAAARNESLRLCSKDWILVMDADERLAPADISRLRQMARGPADYCYRLTTHNYTNTVSVAEFRACAPNDPLAKGFAGWFPSTKVRFFPNRKGARFEGKVHELVNRSLEMLGLRIVDSEVAILHYPYTKGPERIREKQELYLRLGHEKVQTNPADAKAYVELANQYADVGDYAQAAANYREALRLDSSNASVLKDLGAVLHLIKRDEEARQALRLALKLDPSMGEAWRNLGVVLAEGKEWDAAIECFRQGISNDSNWKEGPRYLSVALEGAGRLTEAVDFSRRALESLPNSSDCLHLYIHQMLRLERRPEARRVLEELVRTGKGGAELYNAIGELYFYDNMLEESKQHFVRAGEAGLGSAYNNLGVVLFRQARYSDAREAFENCLRIDPAHPGAHSNLEKAMKRLGIQ